MPLFDDVDQGLEGGERLSWQKGTLSQLTEIVDCASEEVLEITDLVEDIE